MAGFLFGIIGGAYTYFAGVKLSHVMSKITRSNTPNSDVRNYLTSQFIHDNLRYLEGDILTIVDAVAADHDQREAIKSLVRQQFGKKHDWFSTASRFTEQDSTLIKEGLLIPIH